MFLQRDSDTKPWERSGGGLENNPTTSEIIDTLTADDDVVHNEDDSWDENEEGFDCIETLPTELYLDEEEVILPCCEAFTAKSWIDSSEDLQCMKWLKFVHVDAFTQNEHVGDVYRQLINREMINSPNFEFHMEKLLSLNRRFPPNLADELFNYRGSLGESISKYGFESGTGVWDNELSRGSTLFLHCVDIVPKWRQKGVGTALAEIFTKTAATGSPSVNFVFCWPDQFYAQRLQIPPGLGLTQEYLADPKEALIFCRRLGYRRIGDSKWFALPLNPNHEAFQSASSEDYDPPEPNYGQETSTDCLSQSKFRLRNALSTCSDRVCLQVLKDLHQESPINPAEWSKRNSFGYNIVHVAVIANC